MIDSPAVSERWISYAAPRLDARLRLFCLPYAGGGMAPFRSWAALLPADIELCLIHLPGRETRMRETPYIAIDDLVADLADAMMPLLDRPFAIFGHSMGALIAYALTRKLDEGHNCRPAHLFVSARRAPQIPEPDAPLHQLPDAAFVVGLVRRYNGIPRAVLQDIDLLKLFLPTLRADLTMIETYRYSGTEPFNVPITAFGGWEDGRATQADLAAWQELSSSTFALQMFVGGHFYIQSERAQLLKAISGGLAGTAASQKVPTLPYGRSQMTVPLGLTVQIPGSSE